MNDEQFIKLIENFLNICDNIPSDLGRHREKVNSILNELNSVDFKYMQTCNTKRVGGSQCTCDSDRLTKFKIYFR